MSKSLRGKSTKSKQVSQQSETPSLLRNKAKYLQSLEGDISGIPYDAQLAQLKGVLKCEEDFPAETLKVLLKMHNSNRGLFWRSHTSVKVGNGDKYTPSEASVRSIFCLLKLCVEKHHFSVETLNLLADIQSGTNESPTPIELQCFGEVIFRELATRKHLDEACCGWITLLFKTLVGLISHRRALNALKNCTSWLIEAVLNACIYDEVQMEQNVLSNLGLLFVNAMKAVVNSEEDVEVEFNLLEVMYLSVWSRHSQVFRGMLDCVEREIESQQKQESRVEGKSDAKVFKILGICCRVFSRWQSFLDSGIKSECIVLSLVANRAFLMRVIEEIEGSKGVAVGLFQMACFCDKIKQQSTLKMVMKQLLTGLQLLEGKGTQASNSSACVEEQQFRVQIESCLYDLVFRIERSLVRCSLHEYMHIFIESPTVLRPQHFLAGLFANHQDVYIKKLLVQVTHRWINVDVKSFDFISFLVAAMDVAASQDKARVIGAFLRELHFNAFISLALAFFKLSFQGENKRQLLPELEGYELARATSAGQGDRNIFLDRTLSDSAEMLMWREVLTVLQPSECIYSIKCFYTACWYELTHLTEEIVKEFTANLDQRHMDQIYSLFHLLYVLSIQGDSLAPPTPEQYIHFNGMLMGIILSRYEQILILFDSACETRRKVMSSMRLNPEAFNQNLKSIEKSRRMHSYFIKSVVRYVNQIRKVETLFQKCPLCGVCHCSRSYESAIEVMDQYSKDCEIGSYAFIHRVSLFSSSKVFHVQVHSKVTPTLEMSLFNLLFLRGVVQSQAFPDLMELILGICVATLKRSPSQSEREVLRCKIVALDIYSKLKIIARRKVEWNGCFSAVHKSEMRALLREFLPCNSPLVSQYERELTLHLRLFVVDHLLLCGEYSLAEEGQLWLLILQLCMDRSIEMRLWMLNALLSRSKRDRYRSVQSARLKVVSVMTIVSIFESEETLKGLAEMYVEQFQKQECISMALMVLVETMRLVISMSVSRMHYSLSVYAFAEGFLRLWLAKRENQAAVLVFADTFLEKYVLRVQVERVEALQIYHTSREMGDYEIERSMKEWETKEQATEKLGDELIKAIIDGIRDKPRKQKFIRMRKAMVIDWEKFQHRMFILRKTGEDQGKF